MWEGMPYLPVVVRLGNAVSLYAERLATSIKGAIAEKGSFLLLQQYCLAYAKFLFEPIGFPRHEFA
jgi:hypothetical protein